MIKSSEAYQKAIVADGRRMYLKAVIDIIDPDIVQGDVSGSEQQDGISRPGQLWDKKFESTANYASMEPGRSLLSGWYIALPADSATRDWEAGYTGAALSDWDGVFPAPQIMQIEFSNVSILQAMSVAFPDRPEDGVGADFRVEVFSEGVAYYTKEITGNNDPLVPITGWRVNNPDKIRVTVTRWSLPRRRMRGIEIVPGVYEVWTGNELASVSVKMQGDVSCLTLPYGTAVIKMDNQNRRFDPRTKDGVFLSIEERQGIEIYMGPRLPDGTIEYKRLGTFYQASGGWKDSDNSVTMQWSLVDIVGLIAQRTYKAQASLPTTLKGWIQSLAGQLGVNFVGRVRVDPAYANLPVSASGDISKMSCGDILRYVCMATGTWPRADASTGYLAAEPLWNEGSKITLDNVIRYPAMSANDDVASVTINGAYFAGTSQAAQLTENISNPFIASGNEQAAAKGILPTFGGNKLEITGRGDPASEIGDVDTVWLAEGNATTARRVRQELAFSNGVLTRCKSNFIRGDGLFLFENRVQILESGTWTVPEDVWRIRVVLVGHGQAGSQGTAGAYRRDEYQFFTGFDVVDGQIVIPQPENGGYGYDGAGGSGGKVWEGLLDVNPSQVLQISFAGNDTIIWHYSSANGRVYPNGFTDVATGDVFGRTGVDSPKPGSGDGGAGGKGGLPGLTYEEREWVKSDNPNIHPDTPEHMWPGHWEYHTLVAAHPTDGEPGTPGASGSVIIYWEKPEVIEDDGA